jgi:hypothetical protein
MLDFLFGEGQYGLRFLFAFIVVLGLIGLTAWLVRRFGADRLGAATTRGRQPRLAVIDAAAVDGRRRLVLIRRDNVEHLLMIGGLSDVVVETNIMRAAATRDVVPPRVAAAAEPLPRAVAQESGMWPLQPEPMPMAPPPRIVRQQPPPPPQPVAMDEPPPWPEEAEPPAPPQPAPSPPRVADPLAGLAAELTRNPPHQAQPEPAPLAMPRVVRERMPAREREAARDQEPPRPPVRAPQPVTAPEPPPFAAAADHNLAEMAQRLEAALRRPGKAAEGRAEPRLTAVPPPEPPPQVEPPPAPVEIRPTPIEARPVPMEARSAAIEARPAREAKAAAPQRSPYDSLEQEMASLLGRPNSKA